MPNLTNFGNLNIGDKFQCWGDIHLNYTTPVICKCVKISEDLGQEINGINFFMNESDEVFI